MGVVARVWDMDTNEVNIAFEILLEELETVVKSLNEDGTQAFQGGNYERARQVIEDATRLADFHEKIRGLQKDWQTLFAPKAPVAKKTQRKGFYGKLSKGLRTPEEAFRKPILEVLVEMGGSAPMKDVLDAIGKRMKGVLNDYDQQRLPSPPAYAIRWRNTAEWSRYNMVREGLLKTDSPRGMWEITERGRAVLAGTASR